MSHYKSRKRFRPETTVFYHSSKILPELLEDVIACYLNGKRVCRFCYYRRKNSRLVSSSGDRPYCAKCQQQCETVWLMPASRLCENFGNLREIPIPPAPRWFFKNPDKPFGFCERSDHFSCYEMSASSDIWFAHTIEELVIWTIEREHNCSFAKYIKTHRESSRKQSSFSQSRSNDSYHNQMGSRGRQSRSKAPLMDLDLDEFDDSNHEITQNDDSAIYDPEVVEYQFHRTRDIPVELLEEVITCYRNREEVCKWCFFLEHLQQDSGEKEKDPSGVEICAKCNKDWDPVTIMPASRICRNFAALEWVPVSEPVPQRYPKHPHEYCAKDDHNRCFEVYVYSGFWYAHSVEELVVWTVEKEFRMDFSDFEISQATQKPKKPLPKAGVDSTPVASTATFEKYHPREMSFHFVSDIPLDVLNSVVKCYQSHKIVCRTCFFDSLDASVYNRNPTLTKKSAGPKSCEKGHVWLPIRVLPASPLCITYASIVAVPPIPNHMQSVKSAFVTCNNKKHDFCFKKSRETNPWFPHTIEEMVIWTVERETGQNFSEVYQTYLPHEPSLSTGSQKSTINLTSAPTTTAPASNDRMATTSSSGKSYNSSSVTSETITKTTVAASKVLSGSNDSVAVEMSPLVSPSVLASPVPAADTPSSSPVPAANKVTSVMALQKPVNPSPRKNTPRYSTQSTVSGFGLKKTDSHVGIRMPSALSAASVHNTTGNSQAAKVTEAQSDSTVTTKRRWTTNYATVPSVPSPVMSNSSSPASANVVHDVKSSQTAGTFAVTVASSISVNSSPTSTESSSISLSPLSVPSIPPSIVTTSETILSATMVPTVVSPAKVTVAPEADSTVVPNPSVLSYRAVSPSSAVPAPLAQPLLPQMNFSENMQLSKPRDFQVPFDHQLAMSGGPMYRHPIGDMSLPTGGLTLDEATVLFPALLDTQMPSVRQPFLSQAMPSNVYGPRHAMGSLYDHSANNSSTMQVPPSVAPVAGLPVAMDMTVSGLRSSSLTTFNQNEDEEEEVLCCYLCYREFDSAQEIAKHCHGVQHLEVVKKDCGGDRVWRWYPPPPDKSPDDFMMCSRLERCRGRQRCCKAHSSEELREWSTRYTHREKMEEEPLLDQVLITPSSPNQSLLLLSPNKAESQCPHISITASPLMSGDVGKASHWTVTLNGQGWQTLFAVECVLTSPSLGSMENFFKIISIEGDTFFTIKPKSPTWVAQSVKEGILLGRVTLGIRAVPSTVGSFTCQLRFNLGFRELLYTNLELCSQ